MSRVKQTALLTAILIGTVPSLSGDAAAPKGTVTDKPVTVTTGAEPQAAALRITDRSTRAMIVQLGACLIRPTNPDGVLPVATRLTDVKDAAGEILQRCFPLLLPERDGYGRPFLYWSDGNIFVLLSTGLDGKRDREYEELFAKGIPALLAFCTKSAEQEEDDVVFVTDTLCRCDMHPEE